MFVSEGVDWSSGQARMSLFDPFLLTNLCGNFVNYILENANMETCVLYASCMIYRWAGTDSLERMD